MTYPVFASGDVLNASDMNAVGLWRVTNCTVTSVGGTAATASNGVITIGTGNTSVTVNNAFSSDYLNYKVIINGNSASAQNDIQIRYSGTTTNSYYWNVAYFAYGSGALIGAGTGPVSGGTIAQAFANEPWYSSIEIFNPNVARRTYANFSQSGANNNGPGTVMDITTNVHTGFSIVTTSGTITGGTIRVYGYRN